MINRRVNASAPNVSHARLRGPPDEYPAASQPLRAIVRRRRAGDCSAWQDTLGAAAVAWMTVGDDYPAAAGSFCPPTATRLSFGRYANVFVPVRRGDRAAKEDRRRLRQGRRDRPGLRRPAV